MTAFETLPRRSDATVPCPRVPIAIRRASISVAYEQIRSAGSPVARRVLTMNSGRFGPRRSRRPRWFRRASARRRGSRSSIAVDGYARPKSPCSARQTVMAATVSPVSAASEIASSRATLAAAEPSVATRMTRMHRSCSSLERLRISAPLPIGCGNPATGSGRTTDGAVPAPREDGAREPHGGHHHRCVLDRRRARRWRSRSPSSARRGRPLDEDRTGIWSRRETTWLVIMIVRPVRAPHGHDLLRPLRRHGRRAWSGRPRHRRSVRVGDRCAAAARHGPSCRVPRPLA